MWVGVGFAVAGAAALVRELASPFTIGHNLLAIALCAVPVVIWLNAASGFDRFAKYLVLLALPIAGCLWMIRLLRRHATPQAGVLNLMTHHEDPKERPTPESERKPGGEERAEDDPHFNDPVREAIDSEGNPEEKRGPNDDEPRD